MLFKEIPVHENTRQRLLSLADNDRIPHALLIEGPSGTGKFALARAFAQYIHCTGRKPGDKDSCGVCPSCIQHQSMSHIDTHYVFPVVKLDKMTTAPVSSDHRTGSLAGGRDTLQKNIFKGRHCQSGTCAMPSFFVLYINIFFL